MTTIEGIILVPGFLEPGIALRPLQRRLQKRCPDVRLFRDRIAFRKLDDSIDRLCEQLTRDFDNRSIAIITHSFGDWLARAALAKAARHHVTAMVSIAPVVRAGVVPTGIYLTSGPLIPEIKVMMNRELAAANLRLDHQIRRLILWAKVDQWVRPSPLHDLPNVTVRHLAATHLSVILQPNTFACIEAYLFGPHADKTIAARSNDTSKYNPPSDER